MDKEQEKARSAADSLLFDILKTQPEFLKPQVLNDETGKAAGDFISALRDRLTEMYLKAPR